MLLTIDIGNLKTKIGIFKDQKLLNHYRVSSHRDLSAEECGTLLKQFLAQTVDTDSAKSKKKLRGAVISSVVPILGSIYKKGVKESLKVNPILVDAFLPLSIKISYESPETLGADRIANCVAAYELYGVPVIVIDLGTATTFDVVSEKGEFLGGAIAPGIELSSYHLFNQAALLPKVDLEKPKDVIGRSTQDCLKSGIFFTSLEGIDGMIRRLKKKLRKNPKVVATGGLAEIIANESQEIDLVNPFLTLEGLRVIFTQAQKEKRIKKTRKISKN